LTGRFPQGDGDIRAVAAHTPAMVDANGAGRSLTASPRSGPVLRWARGRSSDVVDVFVYVVVLNLAVEFVLELVNLVFGDAVSLGGFVSVTLLVVALLLARAGVRRLLEDG
jgi:hypothetical protein